MYNMNIKSHRHEYNVNFDNPEITIDSNSFVIIDSNIQNLYPSLLDGISEERIVVVTAAEENKSLNFCQKLISNLIDRQIKKNNKLVAIGGGIIQDITGFTASILFRGIDWVFYPTTLLSQADSCIGSKTSINILNAKNIVGTFYPPKEINCHSKFLDTLKESEIKSGIGEILHYYVYDGNPSAISLIENYDALFTNRCLLIPHVIESLTIKKEMVERDEFDTSFRRVFNYGHTFGHAIEAISDYQVPHGQAVTLGMDIANHVSHTLGFLSSKDLIFLNSILNKNIPDFTIDNKNIDLYMKFISKDKKNIDKSIVCILASSFGNLFVHQVSDKTDLKKIILDYFSLQGRQ